VLYDSIVLLQDFVLLGSEMGQKFCNFSQTSYNKQITMYSTKCWMWTFTS
jgi:hypothetical protein